MWLALYGKSLDIQNIIFRELAFLNAFPKDILGFLPFGKL